MPAGIEELEAGDPVAVAEENARRKAAAVHGPFVLGADTLVTVDGDVLGKPDDEERALAYLRRLNGRTHEVVGGIAVARHGEVQQVASAVTRVTFRAVADGTLDWYVSTGEWRGRAGAYAIQGRGAALVAAVDGDYLNVVGLPVALLLETVPGLVPSRR